MDCGVETKFTVTATDNCDASVDISCAITGGVNLGNVSLKDFGGGIFSILFTGDATADITCTAIDACGNKDSCKTTFNASCVAAQGCTPGYWKNHTSKWDSAADPVAAAAGFTTTTGFNAFFGLTAAQSGFANSVTMLQAIKTGGGGGFKLARHGIAGLLSLAAGLNYSLPSGIANAAALKTAMHDAYVNNVFEPLAENLAKANEAGCPLN